MSSSQDDTSPAPDPARLLRDTLALFPTGVAIITSLTSQGERIGATVSSFNSVSLDPPLVLFSIARSAKSFAAWAEINTFAVNVLQESQSALSTQFARADGDKWAGLDPERGEKTGLPLLRSAIAALECNVWARYDGGDHLIIVGEVLAHERALGADARPLVFSASRYARLASETDIATPDHVGHLLHGW
ncbi:MAG: actVB [Hyphomicrobiales bacterium]|nr:actVB [Hyphomicrobiales bacterium]